jgi:hypothetical protein
MKKVILGLSFAVAALGFLMSPVLAANPPQVAPALSAADQAFLSSLAALPGTPATPVLAAKRPRIGPKSLCNATANCWNGGTVSCSGNSSTTSCTAVDGSCPGEPGHVTCDGVTTTCPTPCPGCGPTWCTGEDACATQCDPCAYTYTCNATLCTDHCRCNFRTCLP